MLGRTDLSFKGQREALAQAATGADVNDTYGQAMRAAGGLISEQQRLGQAALAPIGNGITKEALEALWNGRNSQIQSQIDSTNQQISGVQNNVNLQNPRELEVFNAFVKAGFDPETAEAFTINAKDESGLKADIVEAVPNVHGTRGQGIYQLTGPRRDQYLSWLGQNGRNDAWSDQSQADFAWWERNNTEKANWDKVALLQGVGNKASGIVSHVLRPAQKYRDERSARYLALGY